MDLCKYIILANLLLITLSFGRARTLIDFLFLISTTTSLSRFICCHVISKDLQRFDHRPFPFLVNMNDPFSILLELMSSFGFCTIFHINLSIRITLKRIPPLSDSIP